MMIATAADSSISGEGLRVLYVLNSAGGGATQGIYEYVRSGYLQGIVPFAVIPRTRTVPDRLSQVFESVESVPMPWWSLDDGGQLRHVAKRAGQFKRGETQAASVREIIRLCFEWKIDIIHTGTAVTLTGAIAAAELSLPHVWHIKERIGSKNRVQFPLSDAKLIDKFNRLSSRIIAMSDYIAEPFHEFGCENIDIVADGVDRSIFHPNGTRDLRRSLGLDDDVVLCGMVASLASDWKRHEIFIQSMSDVCRRGANAHVLLIGAMPRNNRWPNDLTAKYYQRVRSMAEELIPADRLHICGFVDDAADLMRSLDVLVHTCDEEPFGRIAIESMACGVAVVGPVTGGIAETVAHEETGLLVQPEDTAAYADAIERLVDDSDLRATLGMQGVERVRERFTIQHYSDRMNAIYRSIAPALATS